METKILGVTIKSKVESRAFQEWAFSEGFAWNYRKKEVQFTDATHLSIWNDMHIKYAYTDPKFPELTISFEEFEAKYLNTSLKGFYQ